MTRHKKSETKARVPIIGPSSFAFYHKSMRLSGADRIFDSSKVSDGQVITQERLDVVLSQGLDYDHDLEGGTYQLAMVSLKPRTTKEELLEFLNGSGQQHGKEMELRAFQLAETKGLLELDYKGHQMTIPRPPPWRS